MKTYEDNANVYANYALDDANAAAQSKVDAQQYAEAAATSAETANSHAEAASASAETALNTKKMLILVLKKQKLQQQKLV